jgi:hypothetical protein
VNGSQVNALIETLPATTSLPTDPVDPPQH